MEDTQKNSGNKYKNCNKLNSTRPSNRDRELLGFNAEVLGSIPRVSVGYEFLLHKYTEEKFSPKTFKVKMHRHNMSVDP